MEEELISQINANSQTHLRDHFEKHPSDDLLADLRSIDYGNMARSFSRATAESNNNTKPVSDRMVPIDASFCQSINDCGEAKVEEYTRTTLNAIGNSEVGLLCLAGGQGTRLGSPNPKGLFDIGLKSGKSLYQIQVERALRLARMAEDVTGKKCAVPIFIMTSEHTKAPTEAFFKTHNYFGMNPGDLVLFEQRMIPCLDKEGKIIVGSRNKVARAPDGNGGLYWALKHEGILDELERRGVKYLHVYCVDNVLVKVADPIFMGYCISQGAESGNKVVEKAFPGEAVGVTCKVDGRVQVVEYSEIGKEVSERRDANGKLTFRAANICNHFFTTGFLRRVCTEHEDELPHHIAHKKVPYFDAVKSETVTPTASNGIKLEKFVFDVFQFANSFVVWECRREEEFSPLKNADGPGKNDTPTTAREALYSLHKTYVERAGGQVAADDGGDVVVCEISPLRSYADENIADLVKGKKLHSPVELK